MFARLLSAPPDAARYFPDTRHPLTAAHGLRYRTEWLGRLALCQRPSRIHEGLALRGKGINAYALRHPFEKKLCRDVLAVVPSPLEQFLSPSSRNVTACPAIHLRPHPAIGLDCCNASNLGSYTRSPDFPDDRSGWFTRLAFGAWRHIRHIVLCVVFRQAVFYVCRSVHDQCVDFNTQSGVCKTF